MVLFVSERADTEITALEKPQDSADVFSCSFEADRRSCDLMKGSSLTVFQSFCWFFKVFFGLLLLFPLMNWTFLFRPRDSSL